MPVGGKGTQDGIEIYMGEFCEGIFEMPLVDYSEGAACPDQGDGLLFVDI